MMQKIYEKYIKITINHFLKYQYIFIYISIFIYIYIQIMIKINKKKG